MEAGLQGSPVDCPTEVVGLFDARLTNARFLGDLLVSVDGRTLVLHGPRAHQSPFALKASVWTLVALAIAGLALGFEPASWLLMVAAFVGLGLYGAMWLTATDETVLIPLDLIRDFHVGRPQLIDVLEIVTSFMNMYRLLFDQPRLSRIVSFRAPVDSDSREARFVLVGESIRPAQRLSALLTSPPVQHAHPADSAP